MGSSWHDTSQQSTECEICKNIKPLFQIVGSQLQWCGHVTRISHWQCDSPAGYTHGKTAQWSLVTQEPGGMITLWPCLVLSCCRVRGATVSEIAEKREVFQVLGLLYCIFDSLQKKSRYEIKWINPFINDKYKAAQPASTIFQVFCMIWPRFKSILPASVVCALFHSPTELVKQIFWNSHNL